MITPRDGSRHGASCVRLNYLRRIVSESDGIFLFFWMEIPIFAAEIKHKSLKRGVA